MSEPTGPLSQPRVAVIRSAADRFFFFHAMDTLPGLKAKLPSETERVGRAQLNRRWPILSDDRFVLQYHGIVDGAMGHFVTLLAQAVAYGKPLDDRGAMWVQAEAEAFGNGKLLPAAIGFWFSLKISDLANAPKTPDFNARLGRVVTAINRLGLPHSAAEHKLALAIAIMGKDESRVYGDNIDPEQLLRKAILTQRDVAKLFGVTDRSIRTWIQKGLLTKRGPRVVNDQKLVDRYGGRTNPSS